MANHKSALKRHRQSLVQAGRNRAVRTRAKNAVKAVRLAIANKDQAAAKEALVKATSKGVYHKNTTSRKISRLAHAVNGVKADA